MTDAAAVTIDERVRVCPACDAPAGTDEIVCSSCNALLTAGASSPAVDLYPLRARVFSSLAGASFLVLSLMSLAVAGNDAPGADAWLFPLLVATFALPAWLLREGVRAGGSRFPLLFALGFAALAYMGTLVLGLILDLPGF